MAEEAQAQAQTQEETKPNSLIEEARQSIPEEEKSVEDSDPISHLASDKPEEDKLGEEQAADDKDEYERPEYFPQKFWDEKEGPDIEALVKSYNELQKKFSQGGHKAPKDYDTNFLQEQQIDAKEDPLVKEYTDWAKKYGITQEAYEDLAKTFIDNNMAVAERTQADLVEQKKMLGNKADERIGSVMKFGDVLKDRGVLSDQELVEFDNMAGTALGVKVIEKIRSYYGEQPIPTVEPTEELGMSKDEIRAMVADPKYGKDPAFTMKVEKLFEKAFPGEYKPG
jgi:hypothetical protein